MRTSKLPLAAKCPASNKIVLNTSNKFAVMGTAFHELMAFKIRGSGIINEKLTELRIRYGLTIEDCDSLKIGLYNVELNLPDDAEIHIEKKIISRLSSQYTLTGHADLYYLQTQEEAFHFDWKSGWGDVDPPQFNLQMIGYAVLILAAHPQLKKINSYIVQPKLNQILSYSFSIEEIEKYRLIIIDIIKECSKPTPTHVIGEHCQWCYPLTCSAYVKEIRTFAKDIAEDTGKDLSTSTALQILLPFAKSLSRVCKKIEDTAKAYVDQHESLSIDEDRSYVKVVEQRKEIDFALAKNRLQEVFGEKEIDGISTIGITKLKKLAANTERGLSKKIIAELDDMGAIKTRHISKYKIMHNPIEIEEEVK